MNDNEMTARIVASVVWAVAAVLITLIGASHFYYTFKETAAIRAGLHQSVSRNESTTGGYWTK